MPGESSTPDSKARKTATPGSSEGNKHQQRRQPRRHDKQQANSQPDWDQSQNASGDGHGDFDENGQFVMKSTSSSSKGIKKAKDRRPKAQNQIQPQAAPAWDNAPTQSGD